MRGNKMTDKTPGENGSSEETPTQKAPTRSPEQIRADMKELWPAIPIAAVVLAWFLQPTMAFASIDGMARVGFLLAFTIVVTRAMIVQKAPKAGVYSAVFIIFITGFGIMLFSTAGEDDKRNQRQCALQEKIMLEPTEKGQHALAVFGALKCRPTGIIPAPETPSTT
jgi:hypothetical protein